ncbi:EpsG family protein [Pseudoalteromonas sp. Hal040]|uniref:EpsG family protein n=1 Tax=Pseudoalteromonas sp. Hal040 TaxID=3035157 RepID=UPI00301C08D2
MIPVSIYISSKTSFPYAGNDKAQYLEYIDYFSKGGFFNVISFQPEVVSFGLIKVLAFFFAPGTVILAFFVISFSLLFYSLERVDKKSALFFLLFFLGSSFFLLTYGNVIRQGLALGFLILSITYSGSKRYMIYIFAVFSHFSVLIFLPFILFGLKPLKRKVFLMSVFSLIAILFSAYLLQILTSLSILGFSSFSLKAELYLNWGDYDISQSLAFVGVGYVIAVIAFSFERKFLLEDDINSKAYSMLSSMLVFLFPLLLFLLSVPKIFERVLLYFAVFIMLYISFYITRIMQKELRAFLLGSVSLVLFFGCLIRFYSTPWFYFDNPEAFLGVDLFSLLTDSLI